MNLFNLMRKIKHENILHIDASARYEGSLSRKLSQQLIDTIKKDNDSINKRDITASQLPLLDETLMGAYFTAPEERNAEQQQAVAISDELVQELIDNDIIVIGTPVYNFSVPAALKAWADLVARAGITFKYTKMAPLAYSKINKCI